MGETFRFERITNYFSYDKDKDVFLYLASFEKRYLFCGYHYRKFSEVYSQDVLTDAALIGGDAVEKKVCIEAEADAYLLNLHIMVDLTCPRVFNPVET